MDYHIDFTRILEIANVGVRRAAVFMGLGLNAALDQENKTYELTKISMIRLVPSNASDETVNHYKEEFGNWIVGNGLRTLVETFSLFLESTYHACVLLDKKKFTLREAQDLRHQIVRLNFPDKLDRLQTSFGIGCKYPNYLKTINKARNCLTHRHGIVGRTDCNYENQMQLIWIGIDLSAEDPFGQRHSLMKIPKDGLHLQQGGNVMMQIIEKKRSFELGNKVILLPEDVAEICWFFQREAHAICEQAISYAQKSGFATRSDQCS